MAQYETQDKETPMDAKVRPLDHDDAAVYEREGFGGSFELRILKTASSGSGRMVPWDSQQGLIVALREAISTAAQSARRERVSK